jgi:hypothetical protein
MHRAEMSEQRNASQRVRPPALALHEQPAETLNSRRSTEADVVAEDIIVHYEKPAICLHGPAITAEVLEAASDPRAGVSRLPASGLDL